MASTHTSRARGCLLGLAIGDALGGPTENKSHGAIAQRWGRVKDFLDEAQTGSDDTEYALFNARLLLKHGQHLTAAAIADGWKTEIIAATNTYRGAGFSEMLAMRNLTAGLRPPDSGRHLHSWSDGLAMRVAPFGIVAGGNPQRAAALAAVDGSVTHAGEGIYAGEAVAAGIASAMEGASLHEIIDAARSVVPADSWTRRAIDRGVSIGERSRDIWSALRPLYEQLSCSYYFWSDLAPVALGLALGIVAASRGVFEDAVLGGVNVGGDTDTIAAIAGAIIGAQSGVEALRADWIRRVTVTRGVCLEVVKGMNIEKCADQLAALAQTWEQPS